jgi:hypothetical protein
MWRAGPKQKPFNKIVRKDTPLTDSEIFTQLKSSIMAKGNTLYGNFDKFDFSNGDPFPDPTDALVKCSVCNDEFESVDISPHKVAGLPACLSCLSEDCTSCTHCEKYFLKKDIKSFGDFELCEECISAYDNCNACEKVFLITKDLHDYKGEWECYSCTPVYTCKGCGKDHIDADNVYDTENPFCVECGVAGICTMCDKTDDLTQMTILQKGQHFLSASFSNADELNLCAPCFATVKICSCKSIHPVDAVIQQEGLPGTTECPSCKVTETFSLLDLLV